MRDRLLQLAAMVLMLVAISAQPAEAAKKPKKPKKPEKPITVELRWQPTKADPGCTATKVCRVLQVGTAADGHKVWFCGGGDAGNQ